MVAKVKLYGTGTDKDPYRVKLPTYTLLHGNIADGTAIVSIWDSQLGPAMEALQGETIVSTTEGDMLTTLSPANAVILQAVLDKAYPPAGKFALELA